MDAKTLEALKGSIAKWQAIVDGTGEDRGFNNCPLCRLFGVSHYAEEINCRGCPVFEKTGKHVCKGTPYYKWINIFDEIDWQYRYREKLIVFNTDLLYAALAELEFLKSLLPVPEERKGGE